MWLMHITNIKYEICPNHLTYCLSKNRIITPRVDGGQDRTNPFVAARDDKSAMRPFDYFGHLLRQPQVLVTLNNRLFASYNHIHHLYTNVPRLSGFMQYTCDPSFSRQPTKVQLFNNITLCFTKCFLPVWNLLAQYTWALCLNSRMDQVGFWHWGFPRLILHCVVRKFGYLQK